MRNRTLYFIFISLAVALFFIFGVIFLLPRPGQPVSGLAFRVGTDIPLTGGANRLDYQSIDENTHRLYISHLGSRLVHVFDLQKQKIIADIPLPGEPYGILAVPSVKKVFVSLGDKNVVEVIDERTNTLIATVSTGETPDGITYNGRTKHIFVSDENGGTVTVINALTNTYISDISVGHNVGNTHADETQNIIYSVAGDEDALVAINPEKNKVIQKFELPGCSHPHGFLIDPDTRYAFITCDENNVMVVFDLDSKKIVLTDTVGEQPDVLAYDSGLHRLYITSENGVMTIFTVKKGAVKKVSQGFIASHAHTVAVDSRSHLLYLPLENDGGRPRLRVLQPEGI